MRFPFLRRWRQRPTLPRLGRPADTPRNFWWPVFWATTDDDGVVERMRAVADRVLAGCHFADNFFTWARNNSMLDDLEFVNAWEKNAESESDKAIIWRRYILACAAYHCVHLEGDFVECGAYAGVGVKTVIDYLGGVSFPRDFWMYDLFEAGSPDTADLLYDRVKRKFQSYSQVRIIKGHIPEVFEGQSPRSIAYLHIDLNGAEAELAALRVMFDKVVPGGIIILDDYEWSGPYRPQKLAEDPWLEARQHRVFPLPTGQGLVIKRRTIN